MKKIFGLFLVLVLFVSLAPVRSFAGDQKSWPEFKFQIDENLGFYNSPRRTLGGNDPGWYFTNNTFLRLFHQPKILIKPRYGMLWNLSLWLRTTDSNSQYSKTVLRPFIGPLFYGRLIDNEKWRLQFNESPNIFWSHDLNSPTAKSWSGFEFGNYANMEGTYKPAALSLDIHNWYVHGLNIKAAGASVSEGGVIIGSTLAWNPFSIWKTKMVFLNNLSIYARFREWGWQVQPTGIAAARKWWEEITFGFKLDLPFSIFE